MSFPQYELIDFGEGRRLERFGDVVVDRPALAASDAHKALAERWRQAQAKYHAMRTSAGAWQTTRPDCPQEWAINAGSFRLLLKLAPSGQVGIFPEQRDNWTWIARQVAMASARQPGETIRVLNLFAYTGGSTLAAAQAGAAVAHVDSSTSAVGWARKNAAISGLDGAPIRWLTEDAARFVEREVKRGVHYHGIILDPPSFGRAKSRSWKLETHLPALLKKCAKLAGTDFGFLLLTAHSPAWDAAALREAIAAAGFSLPAKGASESGRLLLRANDGRALEAGSFARLGRKEKRPPKAPP